MMKFIPDRRLHISWLIAWLSFGVVCGIGLAIFIRPGFIDVQYFLIAVILAAIGFRTRTYMIVPLMIMAGATFGLWRGEAVYMNLRGYEAFINQTVEVRGRVDEDITAGEQGESQIRLKSVYVNGQALPGTVWLSASTQLDVKRGDELTVNGRLAEGFGTFPASMYRARVLKVERERHGDIPREVRDWFAGAVRLAIDEPQASLGAGYLLGQRSTLPQELDDQLRLLGLTHVVVASGYNLTILVRFARAAFARVSKYLAMASASGMIISFLMMTGLSPSMSRASLVAGLSLLAWYFGRTIHPLTLLAFAAAVTAVLQPTFVWGDLGWYLSFASFVGILILAPLLQHYFWGIHTSAGAVRRIVVETLSAQLATLPLIALVFEQYSPLALPANVLILPLIPVTMLLTFGAGIGALVAPALAGLFGVPAEFLLTYMTTITDWLANLPWANGEILVGKGFLIGGYIVFVSVCILLWHRTKHNFKGDNIVV